MVEWQDQPRQNLNSEGKTGWKAAKDSVQCANDSAKGTKLIILIGRWGGGINRYYLTEYWTGASLYLPHDNTRKHRLQRDTSLECQKPGKNLHRTIFRIMFLSTLSRKPKICEERSTRLHRPQYSSGTYLIEPHLTPQKR